MQAAVNEDGETELDPLRDSKPVELTEKRRHVLGSPGRVDESSGGVENRLEYIQMPRNQRRAWLLVPFSGFLDRINS